MGIFDVNSLKFKQLPLYSGIGSSLGNADHDSTILFNFKPNQGKNDTLQISRGADSTLIHPPYLISDNNLSTEIIKDDDKEIIYQSGSIQYICEKRPNSDIPLSVKIIDTESNELEYTHTFFDESGKELSKIEKYKPDQPIQTRETFFDKDNNISFQKELFSPDKNITQKEYFYKNGINTTVKTTLKDGSLVMEKPQFGPHKIYIPSSDFGKSNVNIYVLDEKNNTKIPAGDIFNNRLGITLEDLQFPSLEDGNSSSNGTPVVMTSPQIRGLQIGYYSGNNFISFSKDGNRTSKNIYILDQDRNPLRIEKSFSGDLVTEYTYNDNGSQAVTSRGDNMIYLTVKDGTKNTETRYYALDRGRPFSRTKTDRKGREIKEFYNAKTNKWSKEFPKVNISRLTPEKRAEIPLGAKVMTNIPGFINTIDVEKIEIEIMGNKTEVYKSTTINDATKTEIIQIFEILPDGNCGNLIITKLGDEKIIYYEYDNKNNTVTQYSSNSDSSFSKRTTYDNTL